MKLLFEALIKFILGLLIVGALLFLPAGTFNYWNAWLFIGLLFVPIFFVGVGLYIVDKELLAKRLNGKEKEKEQKGIVSIIAILFVLGFIVSGLDFKYGWSNMPWWGIAAGSVSLVYAYGLYIEVMRENVYLSRTIEVQENQKVIDTGLYAWVRHPMYLATTLLFLAFPIILGSGFAFMIFGITPFVLAKRIKNEEKVLEKGLKGYKAYKKKVTYKMIPYIW